MNMPFRKRVPAIPDPSPVSDRPGRRVLLVRQDVVDMLFAVEEARFDLSRAIKLLESGRADAARSLLVQARGKLG